MLQINNLTVKHNLQTIFPKVNTKLEYLKQKHFAPSSFVSYVIDYITL